MSVSRILIATCEPNTLLLSSEMELPAFLSLGHCFSCKEAYAFSLFQKYICVQPGFILLFSILFGLCLKWLITCTEYRKPAPHEEYLYGILCCISTAFIVFCLVFSSRKFYLKSDLRASAHSFNMCKIKSFTQKYGHCSRMFRRS